MSKILQSLATPELIEAIEANFAEEMANMGRSVPGAELHEDAELLWFFTGKDRPNGVLRTRFASDDPDYVRAKVAEIFAYFKQRQVTLYWSLGPSTRPANLVTYLEPLGFTHAEETTGMAIDIQAANEETPQPEQFVITEIEDNETLKHLRSIEVEGFGSSEEIAQAYYETYVHAGFGQGKAWHHYLGWQYGQPVAITSLLLHAGVAGIYGVATLPHARRQGIGASMTLHALHEARRLGYRIAILSPLEMSIKLYRRIGFKEYCTVHHYGWSPDNE